MLVATASLRAQIAHTHLDTIQTANQEAEIVAFDAGTERYFLTNPGSNTLDVFTTSATGNLTFLASIPLAGNPNSVACHAGLVAAAVAGQSNQAPGQVQFFDAATGAANGPSVTVGALPDMLAFTPNGQKVLTANEGSANQSTGLNNPEGSVSIVDVATRTVQTASFAPWNSQKAQLQAAGVRLTNANNVTVAEDVEPEYLTIDATGSTAYVSLQENNAIAVIDIATASVTAILPLGTKNHHLPGNDFDPSDQDGIPGNFQNFPVLGLFQPDALTIFEVGGVQYIATANEGADRANWTGFADETRGNGLEATFTLDTEDPTPETGLYTSAQLNDNAVLGRLKFATGDYDLARGDTDNDGDIDQLYSFGGRSFSIWTTAGALVFDSGDEFGREMLARGLWNEGQADSKGPEPEAVTFGIVGGTPMLFVGLERTSAVMVYDVSNPNAPTLEDVIDVATASGVGATDPEGLAFIAAADNPTGRSVLAVASENGGTLSLFAIDTGVASITTFGQGCPAAQPLTLVSNAPILGSSWQLTTTNIPAGVPLATLWFGDVAFSPAIELTALGVPGCFAHINGSFGAFGIPMTPGAAAAAINIPNNPGLLSTSLTVQAVAFATGILTTSNGLVATFGY